jgi:hypothetical protein
MQFFHTNRFSGAADFAAYVIDAFDWLHREGAHAPKMMSIRLHLRMIGRPGRIGALDRDPPAYCQPGRRLDRAAGYAFDTNDMQFFHTNRFSGAADFAAYVIDAFDWLHREGAHAPKMMSIRLHLRMIGRPGRTGALDRDPPAYCQPRRRLDRAAGRHRQPLACAIP